MPQYEKHIWAYAAALKRVTMPNAHVILTSDGRDLFDWPLHQLCDHVGATVLNQPIILKRICYYLLVYFMVHYSFRNLLAQYCRGHDEVCVE